MYGRTYNIVARYPDRLFFSREHAQQHIKYLYGDRGSVFSHKNRISCVFKSLLLG
jgi:hypothetical protein